MLIDEFSDIASYDIKPLPEDAGEAFTEISDRSRLTPHPLVSIHMMTYNHVKYIERAVKSVLSQRCDFDYELIIGDDGSTDGTRDLCIELQRANPSRIRLLFSHSNAGIGVNTRRLFRACRGEYIAYLEGDDYWIDDLKLKKQVAVLRNNTTVSLIFAGAKICTGDFNSESWTEFDPAHVFGLQPVIFPGRTFMLWTLFGRNPVKIYGPEFFTMTSGWMFRSKDVIKAYEKYECFSWDLQLYDSMIVLALSTLGDVYWMPDKVSVYRQLSSGLTCTRLSFCFRATWLIRMYFARAVLGLSYAEIPDVTVREMVRSFKDCLPTVGHGGYVRAWYKRAIESEAGYAMLKRRGRSIINMSNSIGFDGPFVRRIHIIWSKYILGMTACEKVVKLYGPCDSGKYKYERASILQGIVRVIRRKWRT